MYPIQAIFYTITAHVPERHNDGVRSMRVVHLLDGRTVAAIHPTNLHSFLEAVEALGQRLHAPVEPIEVPDAVYVPDGRLIFGAPYLCWN